MSKPVSDNDTQALEANVKSVIARSDKWQARAEAEEARCKRLEDAGENVCIAFGMGWDMDGVIEVLRVALSDTAQQETGILCDSGGGSNLLAVMTDHKAAEMRERAAKLAEGWWPSTPLNMLAARIRDLPIDPETGEADNG